MYLLSTTHSGSLTTVHRRPRVPHTCFQSHDGPRLLGTCCVPARGGRASTHYLRGGPSVILGGDSVMAPGFTRGKRRPGSQGTRPGSHTQEVAASGLECRAGPPASRRSLCLPPGLLLSSGNRTLALAIVGEFGLLDDVQEEMIPRAGIASPAGWGLGEASGVWSGRFVTAL